MNENDLVLIGKVMGTFGIKGELKVYSESDFVEYRFKCGNKVLFKNAHMLEEKTITSFRLHKKTILITIDQSSRKICRLCNLYFFTRNATTCKR